MTNRAARNKPNTIWAGRATPDETSWAGRRIPRAYKSPLQDAYRKVHDQDNRIVYVLTNTGQQIPGTFWKKRPLVS